MKLSEMTADQVADVLVRIAPEIETIFQDEDILKSFGGTTLPEAPKLPDNATDKQRNEYEAAVKKRNSAAARAGVGMAMGLATKLLKDHKESTFAILAALDDKSRDEFRQMQGLKVIGLVKDMLTDKDLWDFFKQSAPSERER